MNELTTAAALAARRGVVETYTVSAEASAESVEVGETFTLTIDVDNAEKLASGDLVITFDPTVLELTDVQKGELTSDFSLDFFDVSGQLTVSLSTTDGLKGAGGAMVMIEFNVIDGDGKDTQLGLGFVKLSGEFGEDLDWESDVFKQGTSITIGSEASANRSWPLYD